MSLQRIDKFHKTKPGLAVFVVLDLAVAYGFASLAIDRGNLWWYLLAIIFFVAGLTNIVKIFLHNRKAKSD